ncbi:MAG: YbjN domain-containing protein [Aggregatilineales bacterium]
MNKVGPLYTSMIAFFEEDDWSFHPMEDIPVLSMSFTGKSGKWMCYAQAREEQQQFVFYSICPMNVPEERRLHTSEFITRANYGMIIGNFEMDYVDGEVRYKTSIDVEGDDLSFALIKQMVYANVIIMDRYLPGLMQVIFGSSSPLEVIQNIEVELADRSSDSPEHKGGAEDDDYNFKFSLDDIDFSDLDRDAPEDDEPNTPV